MDQTQLSGITNFIWNIANDILRDVFVRGKYRNVILPMTVLRRLDAVLEPTKDAVLKMKVALDREQITNQDDALRVASGQAFYNTSPFLLRDLKSRATQQQLKDDFEAYLDGFSPKVQDILTNFEFRHQIPKLSKADAGYGLALLVIFISHRSSAPWPKSAPISLRLNRRQKGFLRKSREGQSHERNTW